MNVPWQFLPSAESDLKEITDDLVVAEALNPRVAQRFAGAVARALDTLASQPRAGSPRRFRHLGQRDLRVWPIPGFPRHIVLHELLPDRIQVVRVLHGARDIDSPDFR